MTARNFRIPKAVPGALAAVSAAVFCGCVAFAGGSLWGLLLTAAYLFAGVVLPGCALARCAGLQACGLFYSGSIVFGTAVFAVLTAVSAAAGTPVLLWLMPGFGLIWAFLSFRKHDALAAHSGGAPHFAAAGVIVPIFAVLASFLCVLARTKPAVGAPVLPDHDFLWNLGNLNSFLQGFPPADLRFAGLTLTYHWLTELLGAGLCMAVPAAPWDMLAMFLPLAMAAGLVIALCELAALWFDGNAKQTAALFVLLFFCGEAALWKVFDGGRTLFWNTFFRHMLTNINGVGTNTLFLAALTSGAFCLGRGTKGFGVPVFTFVSFVLLALSKGPVAAVVLIGFLCAGVLRLIFTLCTRAGDEARRSSLRTLAAAAAMGAAFLIIYRLLFSAGAGTSVHFSLHATLEKSWFGNILAALHIKSPLLWTFSAPLFWLCQTVLFAPAAAPLALCGLLRDACRLPRLSFAKLFAAACAAGGFLAFYLFDHESMSQIYFAFAGFFFLCLLAAGYLPAFVRRACGLKKLLRTAVFACFGLFAAVGLASAVFSNVYFARQAVLRPAENGKTLALTAAQAETAERLSALGPDTLFLTNRIHTGRHLEGLSNVYTGLSGRQCYMESFKYAVSNMGAAREEVQHRLDVLHAVFGAQTPQQAHDALPEGVTCILYDRAAAAAGWDILEGAAECEWLRDAERPGADGQPLFKKYFETEDTVLYLVS